MNSHQCFITNAALTRHILSYDAKNNEMASLRMRRLSDHRTPATGCQGSCCFNLNVSTPRGLHDKTSAKKDIKRQRKTVWRVTTLGVLDALDISACQRARKANGYSIQLLISPHFLSISRTARERRSGAVDLLTISCISQLVVINMNDVSGTKKGASCWKSAPCWKHVANEWACCIVWGMPVFGSIHP